MRNAASNSPVAGVASRRPAQRAQAYPVNFGLSSAETRGLAELVRLALSPLDHPGAKDWQGSLIGGAVRLLGADKGAVVLPLGGVFDYHAENYEPKASEAYADIVGPLEARLSAFQIAVGFGAHTREMLWEPFGPDFFESAYYCDLIVPYRLHDALGISVALGGPPLY
jgi:hypothetical protein